MRTLNVKKRLGMFVAVPVAALAIAGVASAAVTFGPSRPTFTSASPASYITFNSITDNPTWGDERQLLKVRDANSAPSAYATQANVSDNQEIVMAVYFHNNADSSLNLTATNTRVKFELPTNSATSLSTKAYITADNANPNQVWSTADLTSSSPFTLSYIPGSAKLHTNYVSGVAVSDSVVTDGALIGTSGTDGKVQGCLQFSGYVTIRAKVKVTPVTPTPTPVTPTKTAPAPTKPAPAPVKATVLPNTGAGEVAGLFAGASAAGTAAHMAFRRFRR